MIANHFRNELARYPFLADVFDHLVAQLNGFLGKEHHADGTHGAITADSATVAGAVSVGAALAVASNLAVTGNGTISDNLTVGSAITFGEAVESGVANTANDYVLIQKGIITLCNTATSVQSAAVFRNNNGTVGSIQTNGSATAYNTTSDRAFKDNLTPVADGDRLAALQVYDFTWKESGAQGRGLVAQEAHVVCAYAVTPGEGDRPWMVDYSKFVPDLIAGWQAHEAQIAALRAEVTALRDQMHG